MKIFAIILIFSLIIVVVSFGFIFLCLWILKNKKNTKLYNWVNKHIITETDLEI